MGLGVTCIVHSDVCLWYSVYSDVCLWYSVNSDVCL